MSFPFRYESSNRFFFATAQIQCASQYLIRTEKPAGSRRSQGDFPVRMQKTAAAGQNAHIEEVQKRRINGNGL